MAAAAILAFIGCVDVSPPWKNVAGSGGKNGAGGASGAGGAEGPTAWDGAPTGGNEQGPADTGDARNVPDVPIMPDANTGGSESDTPPIGSGGIPVASTPPATGGHSGAGGVSSTGGATSSGGVMHSGGASGSTGTATRDAAQASTDQGTPEGPSVLGLAVYYACDRAENNRLMDGSGNGKHALLVGNPDESKPVFSFAPDRIGNALRLQASGKTHARVPVDVFLGAKELTFAAWVHVTRAQGWQRILDVGINAGLPENDTPTTVYMALVAQDGTSNLQFMISKSGKAGTQRLIGPDLPTGSWKHVAVVLGAGQAVLYVNGAVAATDSSVVLRPADLGALDYAYIGMSQFSVDPYFDGLVDEFRVYRRALSLDEVAALYRFTGP